MGSAPHPTPPNRVGQRLLRNVPPGTTFPLVKRARIGYKGPPCDFFTPHTDRNNDAPPLIDSSSQESRYLHHLRRRGGGPLGRGVRVGHGSAHRPRQERG